MTWLIGVVCFAYSFDSDWHLVNPMLFIGGCILVVGSKIADSFKNKE